MKDLIWLIPVIPFVGALLNGVVLRHRIPKQTAAWLAVSAVGLSCLLSIGAVASYMGSPEHEHHEGYEQVLYNWIPAGMLERVELESDATTLADFNVSLGFLLDPLSSVMLLFVTFVGTLIHIYSIGYMAHEDGVQRFFTYLNLFMGAMLMLILGNNYLVTFVGWEGVGLCSYLLIGFYYKEEFPPYAGRKAFIVNRVGDFGFVLGLLALVTYFGTLNYTELFPRVIENIELAESSFLGPVTVMGFITVCLFIGAMGKSAQIPLFVWLPDAMAGPTPVSALIHAATMVTAGVYMVARSNALFQIAQGTSMFVAIIGCATAIMAATIGMAQTDIKKVLAYSTVSQLGYMFLACGVGAYIAAIFHVFTHAFFKALLFLGSGSVIHAMGGEQDMRHMGGLRKYMPVTYKTFLVGTIAIAGIPPLAGFFSKDEILAATFLEHRYILWGIGIFTAGLTAMYMFRVVYLTFFGEFRGTEEQRNHLHESPTMMTMPLVVLAVGAVLAGLIGIPKGMTFNLADINLFHHFLEPVIAVLPHAGEHPHLSLAVEWTLIVISVGVAAGGIFLARRNYGGDVGLGLGEGWAKRYPGIHRVLVGKYYVDELYDKTVVGGTWSLARLLYRFDAAIIDGVFVNGARHFTVGVALLSGFFDKYVVDGLVNWMAWLLQQFSLMLRKVQTGLVSQYALVVVIGVLALVAMVVIL
ncbi:MAG: NADH-quinone oxidoreductase subunit L [Acidobacteriota bacterium]|nr:NADH-quinone oxidoreductase subunit L [Acidobacteriota bacterium]